MDADARRRKMPGFGPATSAVAALALLRTPARRRVPEPVKVAH